MGGPEAFKAFKEATLRLSEDTEFLANDLTPETRYGTLPPSGPPYPTVTHYFHQGKTKLFVLEYRFVLANYAASGISSGFEGSTP